MASRASTLQTQRLDHYLERIVDNRGRTPPLSANGIEMIEINALENGRKSPNYGRVTKFVSENTYSSWFRSGHPKCGDTLISTVGAIGRVAYFNDERGCIAQNVIALRPKRGLLVPEFLYYYLASTDTQTRLANLNIGVAQPSLKVPHLLALEVSIPSLQVQQRVANFLSAYDDLIENNQQRIQILEAMVSALHREWFVNLRFPGFEKHQFVSSSLGEIPEGWEIKKLGEILELNYGRALKKEDRHEGDIPVFGSSGIVGTHNARLVEGPGLIVGRKGHVGSVFWCDDDFVVIDTAYYVTSSLPLRFLYYVLPTMNFINSDAAVPGLSRHQAYTLDIIVPPRELLMRFCLTVETFELDASTLKRQIQNLRRTRDLLLPRLLSGQIDLRPAKP